jgi:hypothetical protein
MSYLFNNEVGFVPNAVDAFNRLRVSNPFTIFDSQHRYQENDKWSTSMTAGGSVTYLPNESAIDLSVNTVSKARVIRETKRVFPYQPGKSLLIFTTFVFAAAQSNLRQRVGYFSAENGIFLEQLDNTIYLVLRSFVSGVIQETKVAQSSWNGDKFNGTGPSGRTIDLTKGNILWMDIEWLGVGDVRVGFIVDGRPIVAHIFHNENLKTTTYMTTAVLPLRQEIENVNTTSANSTAKQICSSVISDGGYEGFSRRYNISNSTTPLDLGAHGNYRPILSIRLAPGRLDSVIVPSDISIIATSNTWISYRVVLNPSFAGTAPVFTTHYNNNVSYCVHTAGTTGATGTDIIGGYINNGGAVNINSANNFNFQLGRTLAGVSDTFTLVAAAGTSNSNILADMSWFEIV